MNSRIDQALEKFFAGLICPISFMQIKVMIFIDVTLKCFYKPMISNDIINKTI